MGTGLIIQLILAVIKLLGASLGSRKVVDSLATIKRATEIVEERNAKDAEIAELSDDEFNDRISKWMRNPDSPEQDPIPNPGD